MDKWQYFSPDMPIIDYLGNVETLNIAENTTAFINFNQKESSDIFWNPGPSCSEVNISHSSTYTPKINNNFLIQQQDMVDTNTIIRWCILCRIQIPKYETKLGGLQLYYCLQCTFNTYDKEYLLKNINDPIPKPFYCSICEVRHSELDFHGETRCNICKENFECIVQLEEHYSIKEDHHSNYCMICGRSLKKHNKGKERTIYRCCYIDCKFESFSKRYLLEHLSGHFVVKLFKCGVCGKRFRNKRSRSSHSLEHL